MTYKNTRFVFPIIFVLIFSASAFAKTTLPEIFFKTPENLLTPQDFPTNDINWPDDPFYSLYKQGAPYSLIAHGKKEQWGNWDVDGSGDLKLVGLGKIDPQKGKITGDTSGFEFNPGHRNSATQGYWRYIGGVDWIDNTDDEFELYFSIKAGSARSGGGYDLFVMNEKWYADMDQAITWSTLENFLVTANKNLDIGLADKDISHISFWKGPAYEKQDQPVPEPATLFLMGLGILVFIKLGQKNFQP